MRRTLRRSVELFVPVLVLAACVDKPEQVDLPSSGSAPRPDAVATWRGGGLELADLEARLWQQHTPACRAMRQSGGEVDEVLACYREVAETVAVEDLILSELDVEKAVDQYLAEHPDLMKSTVLNLYYETIAESAEIDDEQIRIFYESRPEQFRQSAQVVLLSLFRRHEDSGNPAQTDNFLRRLRERVESGESFNEIARRYSHSETRQSGGWIGPVQQGDLAPNLEEVAFRLGDGEVSEPIRVKGGAVLLHVRDSTEGFNIDFEAARESIVGQLRNEHVEQVVTQRLAAFSPPQEFTVLSRGELESALEHDGTILEVGSFRWTAADFRQSAGLEATDRLSELDDEERQILFELYSRRERQEKLQHVIRESSADSDRQIVETAVERVQAAVPTMLVDEHLSEELESTELSTKVLQTFFNDNRSLFQSPLRFRIRLWRLPYGSDPTGQLARMETIRRSLGAQEMKLEDGIAELGGELEDLGWRSLAELPRNAPRKLIELLGPVQAGGFTVPFRQERTLYMASVADRREPRSLTFDEAINDIRREYLERYGQEIHRKLVQRRLDAAGYEFHESTSRRLLSFDVP